MTKYFAFLYSVGIGLSVTSCCKKSSTREWSDILLYCLSPLCGVFFIDRPFGYRQFFARRRGSQVRGHKPRNWSGILREYPFWLQNAEGCPQNFCPIATAFLGIVPGLPTFVPRISQIPDGQRTRKKEKLHTKTRDGQEPRASHKPRTLYDQKYHPDTKSRIRQKITKSLKFYFCEYEQRIKPSAKVSQKAKTTS